MKRKEILYFVLPGAMFVIIAALSLLAVYCTKRFTNVNDGWQHLNSFADDVRSGKLHVSTERLLEDILAQHKTAELWRITCSWGGVMMAYFGCISILGLALQIYALVRMNKRLSKP
jgi:hypothetical protein